MKARKFSIALCISLLTCSTVLAEDLVETYAKAQRNDPAIREAEANKMATLEQRPQARASLLPQLDLNSSWRNQVSDGITSNQFGAVSDQENDSDTTTWSVDLSQTLFNTDHYDTIGIRWNSEFPCCLFINI